MQLRCHKRTSRLHREVEPLLVVRPFYHPNLAAVEHPQFITTRSRTGRHG